MTPERSPPGGTPLFEVPLLPPPFALSGVMARLFPLRARARVLEALCARLLEHTASLGRVRVRLAAPYVYLGVLGYARMSATGAAARLGWVAQNELFFALPLVWSSRTDEGFASRGAAVITPFIFVDQPWSLDVGRDLYGWPKQEASFREGTDWTSRSMRGREPLLRVEVAGQPLVEIEREELGPRHLAGALRAPLSMLRESLRVASAGSVTRIAELFPALRKDDWLHSLHLKQVRARHDASRAAYQALTAAPMRTTAVRAMGPLGAAQQWLGDHTGGYRVRIHRHPRHAIADTLGLESAGEPDTFAPLFPTWLELDLALGVGETVATSQAGRFHPAWGAHHEEEPPFELPRVRVHVLALPADAGQLTARLRAFAWPAELGALCLAQARVVLVITGGAGAPRVCSVCLPVRWARAAGETPALLHVVSFAEGDGLAASLRAAGLEVVRAELERPRAAALDAPSARRALLEVRTTLLTRIGYDEEARVHTLLELEAGAGAPAPQVAASAHTLLGLRRVRDASGQGAAFEEWFVADVSAGSLTEAAVLAEPELRVRRVPHPFDLVAALGLAARREADHDVLAGGSCAAHTALDARIAFTTLARRLGGGPLELENLA